MIATYPYDDGYDPAAAVIPTRVRAPGNDISVLVPALVDSGADISVVAAEVALRLALPVVDVLQVRGVGVAPRRAAVHAASVQVGDLDTLVEVLALGDETLLGRNLLRHLVVELDGPAGRLTIGGAPSSV